ncbi:MAG: LysM peptidoglycan-binding domain-containing protein [Pseudomonadota bacterium]
MTPTSHPQHPWSVSTRTLHVPGTASWPVCRRRCLAGAVACAWLTLCSLGTTLSPSVHASETAPAAQPTDLPRPAGIEPWIAFWQRIYGTHHDGVLTLHDARDVSVVYATLETPPGQSLQARRDRAAPEIAAFQQALRDVAAGETRPLTPYHERVLWLWQDEPDRAALSDAAEHIRFQVGHAGVFREALHTARLWRPWINRVLDAHGLPRGLGAIPFVETFFRNEVAPDSGARGIWQFTEAAGRRDLHIGSDLDERMSYYKSTLAAARLLSHKFAITRRWPLAVTAYNHGTRGVVRAVRELKTRDLGVIARQYTGPDFGFASRNFYAQVLAAVHVEANRAHYFGALPPADTKPTRFALQLRQALSLSEISVAQNVSVAGLRAANPDILAPGYAAGKRLPRGFTVWVNCVSDCPSPVANLPAKPVATLARYTVRPGDTLSHIALRVGASVAEIARENALDPSAALRIGSELRVPGAPEASDYLVFPPELTLDAAYDGTTVRPQPLRRLHPGLRDGSRVLIDDLRANRPTRPDSGETVVVPDSTVYDLAPDGTLALLHGESTGLVARWLDMDTASLHRLNGLADNAVLDVGHALTLSFEHVPAAEVVRRRLRYHRDRQYAWYQTWQIDGTITHRIDVGDRLWQLAERDYNVPQWLVLEYNPTLDFNRLRPGQRLRLPRVEERPTTQHEQSSQ